MTSENSAAALTESLGFLCSHSEQGRWLWRLIQRMDELDGATNQLKKKKTHYKNHKNHKTNKPKQTQNLQNRTNQQKQNKNFTRHDLNASVIISCRLDAWPRPASARSSLGVQPSSEVSQPGYGMLHHFVKMTLQRWRLHNKSFLYSQTAGALSCKGNISTTSTSVFKTGNVFWSHCEQVQAEAAQGY